MDQKTIGIVGGVGSYAGIDLIRKIYDNTQASTDQEHLPIAMLSVPHRIVDRSDFILGKTAINPGVSIAEVILTMAAQGAAVVGIPCNTAHAPVIFDVVREKVSAHCTLIHMIDAVAHDLAAHNGAVKKVGVLATSGTLQANIYKHRLADYGIEVIYPSTDIQELYVQPAIYDQGYGIKAFSNPVSTKARDDLLMASSFLIKKGAERIILACTEIPLALTESDIDGVPLTDATTIMAKALIRESRTGACASNTNSMCEINE